MAGLVDERVHPVRAPSAANGGIKTMTVIGGVLAGALDRRFEVTRSGAADGVFAVRTALVGRRRPRRRLVCYRHVEPAARGDARPESRRRGGALLRFFDEMWSTMHDNSPPVPAQRLVGSGRLAGMVQLRQALPFVERLPPVDLTPGEAAALVAALVAIGPYTSATARTALDKLLTALVE